jgi:hypothetical protein
MDIKEPPYLPGYIPERHYPLDRYLPLLPAGVASNWLKSKIPIGSWVLDPFGASPQLSLEIARAGYRLLVTANNPVIAFLLETQTQAFPVDDYRAALDQLAAARKGEERLEKHIQSLYSVECPRCHNIIQARALISQSHNQNPDACLILCPHCGDEGERPITPASQERLQTMAFTNLHHSRAVERVALPNDPVLPNIELALTCYPTRQLYALFTIINRMEGLKLNNKQRRLLTALVLTACDEANTLWPFPAQRTRPRQLVVPNRYRENNLWQVLEEAVALWQPDGNVVYLKHWPNQPPADGGICLFPGRLRELAPHLSSLPISAILTTLPRPNQAFWTLSALWSGWLWGREAVAPIKNVLSRQRYDWNWLAGALEAALDSLQPHLKPDTPFLGLLGELEPSYLSAVLLACDAADFEVEGIALRTSENMAQLHLKPGEHIHSKTTNDTLETIARTAIQSHLITRGEPAPYLVTHTASLKALAQVHALKPEEDQPVNTWLPHLSVRLLQLYTERDWLTPFGANPNTPEKNLWWLHLVQPEGLSLADQIEMEVVRWLQKNPGASLWSVDEAICTLLPGIMTPPLDLIQVCLASYGEQFPPESNHWRLRSSEAPNTRRADLKLVQELLGLLGDKLAYRVVSGNPLVWQDDQNQPVSAFYIAASAIIGRFVFTNRYLPQQSFIVLPGSRTNLLSNKLERDPLLNQAVAKGWHILKFRHLRHLARLPDLNREIWLEQLGADPIDYKATQMEMF